MGQRIGTKGTLGRYLIFIRSNKIEPSSLGKTDPESRFKERVWELLSQNSDLAKEIAKKPLRANKLFNDREKANYYCLRQVVLECEDSMNPVPPIIPDKEFYNRFDRDDHERYRKIPSIKLFKPLNQQIPQGILDACDVLQQGGTLFNVNPAKGVRPPAFRPGTTVQQYEARLKKWAKERTGMASREIGIQNGKIIASLYCPPDGTYLLPLPEALKLIQKIFRDANSKMFVAILLEDLTVGAAKPGFAAVGAKSENFIFGAVAVGLVVGIISWAIIPELHLIEGALVFTKLGFQEEILAGGFSSALSGWIFFIPEEISSSEEKKEENPQQQDPSTSKSQSGLKLSVSPPTLKGNPKKNSSPLQPNGVIVGEDEMGGTKIIGNNFEMNPEDLRFGGDQDIQKNSDK